MFYEPEFSKIWEYWLTIRGDNDIPFRKDFNPAKIAPHLAEIGLMEWNGERYYLRLLGSTAINDLGVDFTGVKLSDFASKPMKEFAQKYFRRIFDFPCGLQCVAVERSHAGRVLEAAVLFLPFKVTDQHSDQIVTFRKELATIDYDTESSNLIHLGVNRMDFIDLGFGTPDINLEAEAKKTRYIPRA